MKLFIIADESINYVEMLMTNFDFLSQCFCSMKYDCCRFNNFMAQKMHRHLSKAKKSFVVVGTAIQLVILPPHIPLIGQGGGILLLCHCMICVVAMHFSILNGRGENRSPFLKPNS